MPPKAKFTPEEILCAALDITREHGIGAVTARELAATDTVPKGATIRVSAICAPHITVCSKAIGSARRSAVCRYLD